MSNLENKHSRFASLWRPELLTDEEMHECLKETCWTARTAAYYVLGLKIPDLDSLEEEKKLCPDFEKYYELFEDCFKKGKNCSPFLLLGIWQDCSDCPSRRLAETGP